MTHTTSPTPDDSVVDRIRLATWLGDDQAAPEVVERHRRSVAKLIEVVRSQGRMNRPDDVIRRAMIQGTLHKLKTDRVAEGSPQAETRIAWSARSIDLCLELTLDTESAE